MMMMMKTLIFVAGSPSLGGKMMYSCFALALHPEMSLSTGKGIRWKGKSPDNPKYAPI